jgi:hypothetical protein
MTKELRRQPLQGSSFFPSDIDRVAKRKAEDAQNAMIATAKALTQEFKYRQKPASKRLDNANNRSLNDKLPSGRCRQARFQLADEKLAKYTPGFDGRLFVVPKPTLETGSVPFLLQSFPPENSISNGNASFDPSGNKSNEWATSLDLTDAYFHILINRKYGKFPRFTWKCQVYLFQTLPFSLSLVPWVFSRVVLPLVRYIRSKGIRIHTYLDDWLILATSYNLNMHITEFLLQAARRFGFRFNIAKSDLVP